MDQKTARRSPTCGRIPCNQNAGATSTRNPEPRAKNGEYSDALSRFDELRRDLGEDLLSLLCVIRVVLVRREGRRPFASICGERPQYTSTL